jgi:hypothetical protein
MTDPLLDETLQDPQRRTPDPQAPPVAHLFLALECGAPLAGPSRHSLANIDEVVIGRGSERVVERIVQDGVRRLVLRFTDPRMSARHARLNSSGKAWLFVDQRLAHRRRAGRDDCARGSRAARARAQRVRVSIRSADARRHRG